MLDFNVGAIDPGKSGGWAIFDKHKQLLEAGRFDFDNPGHLHDRMCVCDIILIERAQGAAGQANQFEYGRAFGRAETAAMMTGAEILYCAPSWWKGKLNVPADKGLAMEKALRDIPNLDQYVRLKADDGVAEAALLCGVLLNPKLLMECRQNNALRERPKKKRVSYKL